MCAARDPRKSLLPVVEVVGPPEPSPQLDHGHDEQVKQSNDAAAQQQPQVSPDFGREGENVVVFVLFLHWDGLLDDAQEQVQFVARARWERFH